MWSGEGKPGSVYRQCLEGYFKEVLLGGGLGGKPVQPPSKKKVTELFDSILFCLSAGVKCNDREMKAKPDIVFF